MQTINNVLSILDETLNLAVIALIELLAEVACTCAEALQKAKNRWSL
jgi:hypothetical protein